MSKNIIIAGASGFIGRAISTHLIQKGFHLIVLTRNPRRSEKLFPPGVSIVQWDAQTGNNWSDQVEGAHAFINLAGENVGSGYWTAEKKKRIRESRILATRALVNSLQSVQQKPGRVIQASAIGYYGSRGEDILTESSQAGKGFIAELTSEWERSAVEIDQLGVPLIIMRIGLVLGKNGGLLSRITLPFRFFVGGHFGRGDQWFSWIHLADLCEAITMFVTQPELSGTYNLTAPHPVMARDFFQNIGERLHRPSWLHLPEFVLRGILGEMADETLLSSQRVIPEKLNALKFPFRYPEIHIALDDILLQRNGK